MTLWKRLRSQLKEFFVTQSSTPLDLGVSTLPGITVTEESALAFTAVFGAVKILAESVASLPLFLFRRLDKGKDVAREHPLFPVLHDLPNPEMTSCEFRETMMSHLALWGNAYAEIERNPLGEVVALWPIHPFRVQVIRRDLDAPLEFAVTLPQGAGRVTLQKRQVFHVRALALDGVLGLSPVSLHRESVALGLAAAQFGARFFGQGMNAGGVMEHPKTLSDPAHARLRADVESRRSGLEHAHRILILEEGMKFNKLTIPPDDAQWLQTRKFQVTEIARIYRIPPHKLGDLERATFSNIEEQSIEFVTDTLMPWLRRWEQAISRDLLGPSEREGLFAEFKLDALLRGKTTERFAAYATARQWGWLNVDDIRELENMNPLAEQQGTTYLSPMNMISAEQALLGSTMREKIEALGVLIRAGYDPEESARIVGLPPIRHSGLPPITVQQQDGGQQPFGDTAAMARVDNGGGAGG